MVKQRSPLMTLVALEVRHSLPTFLKTAKNFSGYISARVAPKSNLARAVYHGFRNWYEAGWPVWGGTGISYVPSIVQDARWDQNHVTRREMLRRMRYWSQNSALLESILSVGERYTVGSSGLHVSVYPESDISSEADDWYSRAEQVIQEWFQDCGWNGETMERLLKVGYRCQKVDGDAFYLKTRKLSTVEVFGRKASIMKPCLQLVESHRCETPWNKFDSDTLIDGVQFETISVGQGQEKRSLLSQTGFWFRSSINFDQNQDSWNLIPKAELFHLYNSHRANQYRGLSDFYACEMDLHKLEDVIEIELKAQDSQSVRAVGIESQSGAATSQLDPKLEAIRIATGRQVAGNGDAQKEFLTRIETYRKETGAYVYGLKTGEKIHFDAPNRPSDSTLNLLEFLTNNVVSGGHAPRCLVFQKISGASARAQGTEVRAELDNADLYYRGDYQKWKHFVKETTIWFMEWAIKNDRRVADAPPDWKYCLHIQQPEACNVDVGHTTQAQLMMLAAGAMDYEMILGPQGTSFMSVAKRLSRQQKWMEKNGLKVTLPALLAGQIPLEAPAKETEKEVA